MLRKVYPNVTFYGDVVVKDNVVIGEGTKIGEYVIIAANAKIGKNCSILYHVTICKDAIIDDGVFIGPNTTLLNDKYPPSKVSRPPRIFPRAIIGGGVVLCPNVAVGTNAVVGAGSVVTESVPMNEVWVGNPAKFLMTREEYDRKHEKLIKFEEEIEKRVTT